MTTTLVLANVFFAAAILAGLAVVCRLGHRLGSDQHDHRLLSLPHRELTPSTEREAA